MNLHPRGHSGVRRSDAMLVRFWMKRVIVSGWSVDLALSLVQVEAA